MRYQFADCELDTQRYVLTRSGQEIKLRPQVFQLLVYFLTNRERVVTKQDLVEEVWAAQATSDAALETGIRAVRRAVGDSGRTQQIIQTNHGHGYRFIAPVTVFADGLPDVSSQATDTARPQPYMPSAGRKPCVSCGHIQSGHAAFCVACGTRFWQYCARCGHTVWLPASQCAVCAWPVTNRTPASDVMGRPNGGTDASTINDQGQGIGDVAPAVVTWQQAGQEALKRAEYAEAARYFRTALEHLSDLPASVPVAVERHRLDLRLHLALGNALMASQGYTAPEVGAAFERARDLGEQLGERQPHFAALRGLRRFYENRGDLLRARSCGEQLIRLAEGSGNADERQEAYYSFGHTLYSLGELHLAATHLDQGAALIDPQHLYAVVFHLLCQDLKASCLWLMGYPDQALTQMHQVLPLAQARAGPLTLVHVFFHTAQLHHWRRDVQAAQKWIEDVITLATQWSLPHWLTAGMNLQAWVLMQQGRMEEGIEQLHAGLRTYRERNAYVACQAPLVLLAEAYWETGETQKGLDVLEAHFDLATQASGHWREAELYRLKGELLAAQDGTTGDAEAYMQRALDMARAQGAKSLELRAAMSLSRWWQRQGHRDAARQLLTACYAWFTEGFEIRDLRAARELLATLA